MNKKKIIIIFTIIVTLLLKNNNVHANEIYYINENGVAFAESEYIALNLLYWDGCQELFTKEDYIKFKNSNIMNSKINIKVLNDKSYFSTNGSSHTTSSKSLKIASSCSDTCLISITATWIKDPSIRSYDVIGAYLFGTELLDIPQTFARSDESKNTTYDYQKFNNGLGASIELPQSGSNVVVNQTFRVKKSGTIYASYQHAKKAISLANSKNYTISSSGFGGVFKFSGPAVDIYDQMGGVDIKI